MTLNNHVFFATFMIVKERAMLLTHVETIHSHTLIYGSMTCFEYSYHVSTKLCNYELLGFRLSKQSYMWFTHGCSLEDFFSLMMSSTRRYGNPYLYQTFIHDTNCLKWDTTVHNRTLFFKVRH